VHSLNPSSQYELFTQEVFGEHADLLWNTANPQGKIAECVSYIKDKCIRNTFRQTIIVEEGSPLSKYKRAPSVSPWDIPLRGNPARRVVLNVPEGTEFTSTTAASTGLVWGTNYTDIFADEEMFAEPPRTISPEEEAMRIRERIFMEHQQTLAHLQASARAEPQASATLNSLLNRI
jgi:hypothetical protein